MSGGPYEPGGSGARAESDGSQTEPETFQNRVRRLAAELARIGVTGRQIERLFATYEIDEIEQQIVWLPYRRARNPASVVVMAICERYEKPARLE